MWTTLDVVLDLDPGLHRTGIEPGETASNIAQSVQASSNLQFRGLQMYAGHLMHVDNFDERRDRSLEVMRQLEAFRGHLADRDIVCDIVSGGGTGTFDIDPAAEVLNELQAGSYLFMDRQYNKIEGNGVDQLPFMTSLFVQTTVVSANHANLVTTDAGLKAFATDDESPVIYENGPQDGRYFFFGDEHGGVRWQGPEDLKIGDWMRAVTPHCDPTFNLYDVVHAVRGNMLVDIWPIDGRGRSA